MDEHSSHSSEITAVDSGLLALKTSVQKLHVQIDHIQRRRDEWVLPSTSWNSALLTTHGRLTRQISDALRQKRKDFAMTYLRNRKQHEDVLKKRLSSLELLQSTLLRVETSAGDIEVSVHVGMLYCRTLTWFPDHEVVWVVYCDAQRDSRSSTPATR